MLRTAILTADPETGAAQVVPGDLLNKLGLANDVLEQQLGDVARKFDITARWHFRTVGDRVYPVLELQAEECEPVWHTIYGFADSASEDAIRQGLQYPLTKLALKLYKLVQKRFEVIERDTRSDLATISALGE